MNRAIRQAARRPEGQALVLAALMLLVLSIAVLTTVNLGHTVSERVRLQNSADAAAYSMAAMEARAFNFYAFANRTQVSHYVSAMLWQSLLSFAYWGEAFLVDAYGVMLSLNICAKGDVLWDLLCMGLRVLLPFLDTLVNLTKTTENFLRYTVLPHMRRYDYDAFIGRSIIPAYRMMNELLQESAVATLAATLTHVSRASSDVIAANDPGITARGQLAVSGALSACMLRRAHDTAAAGRNAFTPLDPRATRERDKVARAKRIMAGIANATRFACDLDQTLGGGQCAPGWVTSRTVKDLLINRQSMGAVADYVAIADSWPEWKWGQTKLLTYGASTGLRPPGRGTGNFIRDWEDRPNRPIGQLAQGDAMGSDDSYRIPFEIPGDPFKCTADDDPNRCWGDPAYQKGDSPGRDLPLRSMMETSIWAMSRHEQPGGRHWRLVYRRPLRGLYPAQARGPDAPIPHPDPSRTAEAELGLSWIKRDPLEMWVANTRMVRDGNHDWPGLVPFSNFEPGQYASVCPAPGAPDPSTAATRRGTASAYPDEFNQPSTFVVLNKTPPQLANLNDDTGAGNANPAMLNLNKSLTVEFAEPTRLVFDDTRQTFLGASGLNAVTRAQAYYHRPGNWTEQPNFFNPYWRPRLASVWQTHGQFPFLTELRGQLPGPLRQRMQKVLTH